MLVILRVVWVVFFFFKQKTAYEIGTGDWSSDVCSSVFLLIREKMRIQTLIVVCEICTM